MNQDKNNNGGAQDLKNKVANKALSAGAQAMGVPKPLADLGSKAVTKAAGKQGLMNPATRATNKLGNNGNFYKNGLNSAPTNKQNNIGKGSHSSSTSSGLGKTSSSTSTNQTSKKGSSGSGLAGQDTSQLASKGGLGGIVGGNSSGGDQPKSTSDQLMDSAKSLLTGGAKKPPENAPASVKFAYTVKKWGHIIKLLGPILPYIFVLFIIMITIFLILAQIMIMRDKINDAFMTASTGIEKFVNYMNGDGWATEEETFYKTLEAKYDEVATLNTENGEKLELDVPLIAATVNYTKISDVNVYEDAKDIDLGEENADSAGLFSSYFSPFMEHENMKSFYYVANNKLGDYRTLAWGHRRLLGHMVGYKIKWEMCSLIEAFRAWVAIFTEICKFTYQTLSDFYADFPIIPSPSDLVNPVGYILDVYEFIRTVFAYEDMGPDHDSYFKYQHRNIVYEFNEFIDKVKDILTGENGQAELEESLANGDDGSKWYEIFPAPKVYYFMTVDRETEWEYGHYLENVYIPGTFFSKESHNLTSIERSVDEIYKQRDDYIGIVGNLGSGTPGGGNPNCQNCAYDLSTTYGEAGTRNNGSEYSSVSNVKVTLHKYYDSPKGGIIEGAENIDFEKYVLGVVFAEIGNTNLDEYAKCQAVAARSYALTRPFEMGNKGNTKWEKNGDNWILHLRGSVNDQVYCDPDEGCSRNISSGQDGDVYPGATTKPHTYKKPLDSYSDGTATRNAVNSTAGEIVVNASNQITNTPFTANNGQKQFREGAQNGKLYTTIIPQHYTKRFGQTMTISQGNCSASTDPACTGGGKTGDWASWKQYDERWGSIPLGNRTIKAIGCAATSVAIQIARSEVQTTFSDLNPGTFVEAYKAAGGFTSGGSIYFDKVHLVAPNFKYAGRTTLPTDKSGIYNAIKEKVDAGYYVVLEVKKRKGGQHWVAVISCQNDVITMADPASTDTDVFAHYGYNGISDMVYYKVG